ncbi:MAG: SGNH/GDSL hydrolase family protein [Liquorilactobacillus nagelii]
MHWQIAWYHQIANFSFLPVTMPELTEVIQTTCNLHGGEFRATLTNYFGTQSLIFDRVEVGLDPMFHVKQPLFFHNSRIFKIPAGKAVVSDPCQLTVHPGQKLYFRISSSFRQTYCDFASTYNTKLTNASLIRRSNHLPTLRTTFTARRGWFSLAQVEVLSGTKAAVIEFTGDSLAEMGLISDELTEQLYLKYPNQLTVLNSGISGNRLLYNAPQDEPLYQTFGTSLAERLPLLMRLHRPKLVICFVGSNDLLLPLISRQAIKQQINPTDFTAQVEELFNLVEMVQSQLLFSNLLPFKLGHGQIHHSANYEQALTLRKLVNSELAHLEPFTSTATAVVKEDQLVPAYDLGDHLHLNQAGGQLLTSQLLPAVEEKLLSISQ